ncbi:MAG: 3-oxoacyl-[acyl-carrier-protein] reductase [bacterium JZ-2024 1]
MFRLDEKKALVTGGSRGIGRAICLALAEAGAAVGINYRIEKTQAEAVKQEILAKKGQAEIFPADVSDKSQVEKLVNNFLQWAGKIDILVNNAGIRQDALFSRMSDEQWDAVLKVNLQGTYYVTKTVLPHMLRNKWGRIITLSSLGPFVGSPGQANYDASKLALVGMMRSLARELAPKGITVNLLAPGLIESDFTKDLQERFLDIVLKTIPMGRFGTPEEVACAVVFLASDEARYITGQTIHINGGTYMS